MALLAEAVLLFALPAAIYLLSRGLRVSVEGSLLNSLAVAFVLGGPALLVGSLILPLTLSLARGGAVGSRMGTLLAVNTLGGIVGSVFASVVMLDLFGLWPSLALLGLGYAVVALPVLSGSRVPRVYAIGAAAAMGIVLLTPLSPWKLPVVGLSGSESLVEAREGAYGIVSVTDRTIDTIFDRRLKINNYYSAGGTSAQVNQERLGHIPLVLHPNPRSVLFVGSATGGTAAAAVLHPTEKIALVEIVPEVQALAAAHFPKWTRNVHHDPRTRLVVEDGRNHLRAVSEQYDVVVTDLMVPWHQGVGSLYSREHYEAVKKHLTGNGVFCQWMSLYEFSRPEFLTVLATFLEVFPNATLWRGDFSSTWAKAALIGFANTPPSVESVEARLHDLRLTGLEDRFITDPRGFWMFYIGPLRSVRSTLEPVPLNTDDTPHFEYLAGRSDAMVRNKFLRQVWPDFEKRLWQSSQADSGFFAGIPRDSMEAGLVFSNASRFFYSVKDKPGARSIPELQKFFERLHQLVPAALLNPPDPTVAEVWP